MTQVKKRQQQRSPFTADDIARRFLNSPPAPRPAVAKKKPRKRAK